MIDLFDYLDSKKYNVISEKRNIKIFRLENDLINQEKFIMLTEQSEQTVVFVHSRDDVHEIASFVHTADALALAIVLCYKHFESVDQTGLDLDELRTASNMCDLKKISEILSAGCREKYFSMLEFREHAICLIRNQNLFDVYLTYGNTNMEIVKDVTLYRASIVTSNYAKLLQRFDQLFFEISGKLTKGSRLYKEFLVYFLF